MTDNEDKFHEIYTLQVKISSKLEIEWFFF